MVVQYPHSITVSWKTEPTLDENGDWIEGSNQTFISQCRAEGNSEGKVLTGVNSSTVYFSFLVYLPKTESVIPYGASVEVILSSNHTIKGSLKNQHNGQLNTRLWV